MTFLLSRSPKFTCYIQVDAAPAASFKSMKKTAAKVQIEKIPDQGSVKTEIMILEKEDLEKATMEPPKSRKPFG